MKKLTDDEASSLSNYLRAAADKYESLVIESAQIERADTREAFAQQFERQAKDARQWAEYFDRMPSVVLATCEHCANETAHPATPLCADEALQNFIRHERLD